MSSATIDLTTLDAFLRWLPSVNPSNDEKLNMQSCITAASLYWLQATGKKLVDGKSPFVQQGQFDEQYDGPGGTRLFVRNPPVRSIISLGVGNVTIPPSTTFGTSGYVIDASGKSIALRTGAYRSRYSRGVFCQGIANIHLVSMCGFDQVPADIELACKQMVAVNYKRRQWVDQASIAMANGAGTVTYRDWELPPEVVRVIDFYSRTAVVY